jgi:hypothetical protein
MMVLVTYDGLTQPDFAALRRLTRIMVSACNFRYSKWKSIRHNGQR